MKKTSLLLVKLLFEPVQKVVLCTCNKLKKLKKYFQVFLMWARGWINHSQLPIVLRAVDAAMAQFLARTTKLPPMKIKRGRVEQLTKEQVPPQYQRYLKVFSNKESKRFPPE